MGLGMNAEELRKNSQLTESVVQDLNKDPKLPFEVKRVFFFFSISSMEKNRKFFFHFSPFSFFLLFSRHLPPKKTTPFSTNRKTPSTSSPTASPSTI